MTMLGTVLLLGYYLQVTGIRSHTLSMLVNDSPGVLNIVTGVFARRGYNIQVYFFSFFKSISVSQAHRSNPSGFSVFSSALLFQSLAVGRSEVEGLSRLTTVVPGTDETISKLVQQLYKLVELHEVQNLYEKRIHHIL